jgi:hypothetical protein
VYGVTQGEKAPVSAARIAKDQQVVEADLRDKDPEWFQTQGTENHPNKERTTQRFKRGSDATRTTRRARATQRVRVQTGEVTQGGSPIIHSNDRSSGVQAFAQEEAVFATDWCVWFIFMSS